MHAGCIFAHAAGRAHAYAARTDAWVGGIARGAFSRRLLEADEEAETPGEAVGGELICLLHRGLARGIAARAAPDVRVDELVFEEPRRAGCRLRLSARAGAV